jgi:2-alkyl-3-oxoalkanoate reductase
MKVFVAGATGAIGKRLLPQLVDAGHEVVAMTRHQDMAGTIYDLGAVPVIGDGLDRASTVAAVVRAQPDVVVHQMTGLAGVTDYRRWDDAFALTNRLRVEGTDNLLEGARAAGAHRFVAQSFGNWNYERSGGPVKTEADPLDPEPPASMRRTLAAIRHLEHAVVYEASLDGIALRYGNLHGPGTSFASDGEMTRQVSHRRLPIIGDGAGVWSFVHVDDAAAATVAAIEWGAPGVYNVVDDRPTAAADWLPQLADALGAKPPRHIPTWLGRLAAGEAGVSLFTRIRGASNAKAKRELGWTPRHARWQGAVA